MDFDEFAYMDCQGVTFDMRYEQPRMVTDKPIIFYLHGGGLIYGKKEDLPLKYRQFFLDKGYPILEVDYPFIPEIRIDQILESLKSAIFWWKEHKGKSTDTFVYFGRSAGAYLALLLAKQQDLPKPKCLICFYGYYSLEDTRLSLPSSYYQNFPLVPFMDYYTLIQDHPVCSSEIADRFSIYVAYRQMGNWTKEILGENSASEFSLTSYDLSQLPPTFIAASQGDKDIPFEVSKEMNEYIPCSYLFEVSEPLPHDFDSDMSNDVGMRAYEEAVSWMEDKII